MLLGRSATATAVAAFYWILVHCILTNDRAFFINPSPFRGRLISLRMLLVIPSCGRRGRVSQRSWRRSRILPRRHLPSRPPCRRRLLAMCPRGQSRPLFDAPGCETNRAVCFCMLFALVLFLSFLACTRLLSICGSPLSRCYQTGLPRWPAWGGRRFAWQLHWLLSSSTGLTRKQQTGCHGSGLVGRGQVI